MAKLTFEFQQRPSILAYTLRAFYPSQGLKKAGAFRRAFHHSQLVPGQCMARLPARDTARPQRPEPG